MIIRTGTTSTHPVKFIDSNGNPVTPTSMTYSIIDSITNTVIVGPLTITPSGNIYNIIVTAVQNAFTNNTNHIERKLITGTYTYAGNTGTFELDYTLTNMTVTIQDVMDNLQQDLWILDSVNPTDYVITEDEVESFIIKGMRRVAGYFNLQGPNELPVGVDTIDEAVSTWAAGLLMNKYQDGDGDSKVKDAYYQLSNYSLPISPDPDVVDNQEGGLGILITDYLIDPSIDQDNEK
jgi:hypothetical protein